MKFSKLQAAGNDFILVDARNSPLCHSEGEERPKNLLFSAFRASAHQDKPCSERSESIREQSRWAKLAQAMCQRHFGIGADGLILVQDSNITDLRMRIFNPDGSEAEVCGNGLRCFAKYAIEKGITSYQLSAISYQLTIETLSGIRKTKAYMSGNKVNRVEVNMGRPQFEPEQLPITLAQPPSLQGRLMTLDSRLLTPDSHPSPLSLRGLSRAKRGNSTKQSHLISNYPLEIGEWKLALSLLSMGNPHAVSFLSQPVADFPLGEVGPKVERHPMFPKRTNFEIARVLTKEKVEARVWERGVGETLACGSGACAIAVAAQLLDYVGNQVDIMLPGGTLTISWDMGGEVLLSGPVEEAFSGEWTEE